MTAVGRAPTAQYADSAANAWGWITLILGVIMLFAAFGILKGETWARIVGVIMAGLVAIDHFTTVRGYPIWSMIVVLICVFVIYALIVHGRELRRTTELERPPRPYRGGPQELNSSSKRTGSATSSWS